MTTGLLGAHPTLLAHPYVTLCFCLPPTGPCLPTLTGHCARRPEAVQCAAQERAPRPTRLHGPRRGLWVFDSWRCGRVQGEEIYCHVTCLLLDGQLTLMGMHSCPHWPHLGASSHGLITWMHAYCTTVTCYRLQGVYLARLLMSACMHVLMCTCSLWTWHGDARLHRARGHRRTVHTRYGCVEFRHHAVRDGDREGA